MSTLSYICVDIRCDTCHWYAMQDTYLTEGAIFALENILQRLIVLQPFLTVDFPRINQVIYNVRTLVDELKEMDDEMQRSHCRSKGKHIYIY